MKVHLSPKKIKSPIIYIANIKKMLVFLDEIININDQKKSEKKEISIFYKDEVFKELSSSEVMDEIGRNATKIVSFDIKYSNPETSIFVHACTNCGITVQVQSTVKGMATEYEEKIKSYFNRDSFNWIIVDKKLVPILSLLFSLFIFFYVDVNKYLSLFYEAYRNVFIQLEVSFTLFLTLIFMLTFSATLLFFYSILEKVYKRIVIVDEFGQKSSRILKDDIFLIRLLVKKNN